MCESLDSFTQEVRRTSTYFWDLRLPLVMKFCSAHLTIYEESCPCLVVELLAVWDGISLLSQLLVEPFFLQEIDMNMKE